MGCHQSKLKNATSSGKSASHSEENGPLEDAGPEKKTPISSTDVVLKATPELKSILKSILDNVASTPKPKKKVRFDVKEKTIGGKSDLLTPGDTKQVAKSPRPKRTSMGVADTGNPWEDYLRDVTLTGADWWALPLNEEECILLTSTWKDIHVKMQFTGFQFFNSMFENDKNVKKFLDDYMKVHEGHRSASDVISNQAALSMGTLHMAIMFIDRPDDVRKTLLDTGKGHHGFAHFRGELFWASVVPFLSALKGVLGDKYDQKTHKAFKSLIMWIIPFLIVGCEQGSEQDFSKIQIPEIPELSSLEKEFGLPEPS